jgi:hypothetical protein
VNKTAGEAEVSSCQIGSKVSKKVNEIEEKMDRESQVFE